MRRRFIAGPGVLLDPGADAAQDRDFLVFEPGPREQPAQPRHQLLRVARVEEPDVHRARSRCSNSASIWACVAWRGADASVRAPPIRTPRRRAARMPLRPEAAPRLRAQAPGHDLHCLAEVQRLIVARPESCTAPGTGYLVDRQAGALGAEHRTTPGATDAELVARDAHECLRIARGRRTRGLGVTASPRAVGQRLRQRGTTRAAASVVGAARAIASGWLQTSGSRGDASTSRRNPIARIARAAAPTLPGWLVPTSTNSTRSNHAGAGR